MSHFLAHRMLIEQRATQLSILGLFWFGANQHLGVLTGNLRVCPPGANQLTLRFERGVEKHPEEGEHHATQSAA